MKNEIRITGLCARSVNVPLQYPVRTAVGTVATSPLRASALAEQAALPMSSHIFQEFSAHLLAVTPACHWLERMDLAGPVLEPAIEFKDGMAHFGQSAGAGIVWREDQVERFTV